MPLDAVLNVPKGIIVFMEGLYEFFVTIHSHVLHIKTGWFSFFAFRVNFEHSSADEKLNAIGWQKLFQPIAFYHSIVGLHRISGLFLVFSIWLDIRYRLPVIRPEKLF